MINWLLFCLVRLSFETISAFITAISVLLSTFEHVSALLFELASDLYGAPPRASFPKEKCAVLILGAHEGVGRNAALSFSELGYTVFALCPNRQEESGPHLTSGRSRDVASTKTPLVPKKKASLHLAQQKGKVAIDPVGYGGAYAIESVVSIPTRSTLIISPTSNPLRGTSPPFKFENASDSTERPDVPPGIHADEDAWRISIVDEVTEPVIMACDYRTLLSEASGRVIILSNFTERSPLAFFSFKTRTAAAENLAEMLEFQGIRVSSIQFGPLAGLSPLSHSIKRGAPRDLLVHALDLNSLISSNDLPKDWQDSFNLFAQKISRQLTAQDNLLLSVLHRIVQSRHPKYTYTVGVYPVLRLALGSAPISARMAVKSFMRWAKSTDGLA